MATKAKPKPIPAEKRPPVVVVLGHVDHGKTTLLDYLRKANVAAKETGGITQHVGAYQVTHAGKILTFLDTPGHEAFSEMRRRGARVADLAVLVVAADEGVKPQTLEAAKHVQEAEVPFVVALNKMDRPNADPMRSKKELSENNVLVEEWGGTVPVVEVSAKSGQGVPELLDMLLLMWDMEDTPDLSAGPGVGVVIESRLDARRGPAATILVTKGMLKRGDAVKCGETVGKIRILEDYAGKLLEEASVSTPVLMLGFEGVPRLGDACEVVSDLDGARTEIAHAQEAAKIAAKEALAAMEEVAKSGKKILPVILKCDVKGSEEAIVEALAKVSDPEVGLRVLDSGAGDVTEADVKKAEATKAVIVAFRVAVPKGVEQYARQRTVTVLTYDLIYECLMGVRRELSKLLPAEVIKNSIGKVTLLAIFKREKDGLIVGGRVTAGKAVRGALCDVVRGEAIVSEGKIRELKIGKDDASEAANGQECGMLYVGRGEAPEKGDTLELYEKEEHYREL